MRYGSLLYVISVLFPVSLALGLWWSFRTRQVGQKVILALMLVNTFQHFCKCLIWPQHMGEGFTAFSTAYNVCAVLIIASPGVFLWGTQGMRDFLCLVGTVAGLGAIAVPVWFIGKDLGQYVWSYARFYFCHCVLFLTSVMPLVMRWHRPQPQGFWKVGLYFLLTLWIVLINDIVFIVMGIYPGADARDLYGSLVRINPFSIMGPHPGTPWAGKLVQYLSPGVLVGRNPAGLYVPVLWYALPLYGGITAVALPVFRWLGKNNK